MNKKMKVLVIVMLLVVIVFVSAIYIYKKIHTVNIKEEIILLEDLNLKIEDTNEFDISKMQDIDLDFASSTFLIEKDKIQGIIGKVPMINVKSSMYVVIEAEDENLQDIKLALESYATEYELQWSNYLPDQYELVKNRKIGIKDNYVYMIISENPDKIVSLIK